MLYYSIVCILPRGHARQAKPDASKLKCRDAPLGAASQSPGLAALFAANLGNRRGFAVNPGGVAIESSHKMEIKAELRNPLWG